MSDPIEPDDTEIIDDAVTPVEASTVCFEARILASDVEGRTITGLVVPFGKVGNTSVGPVQFSEFAFGDFKASDIVLNLEHDRTRPIGRGIDGTEKVSPAGIAMGFKIAPTTAGTDALIEAADGLRTGISIEANPIKYTIKGAVMHVTAAQFLGAGLVTHPAFDSARVTNVAASDPDPDSAPAEAATSTHEENEMSEQPINEPTVEAAEAPIVQAAAPVFTKPRHGITNGATYLEHTIKAAMGDDESRSWIKAADDSSTTNTGLTLAPHMNEFITTTLGTRPAFDAVRQEALPATGLSFTIPRLTGAPAVADVNEEAAVTETGMTSTYLTVNVDKFAGMNTVSWELLDRSGPSFYSELLRELQNAYALATDKALIAAFTASGTAASTTAATASGFQSFVATESAAAYKGSGRYATGLVASPDVWAALMGYQDGANRPIYNVAAGPSNAPGSVGPSSVRGNVLGLDLYVDHGITVSGVIDESCFIVARDTVSVYESPTARLQVNQLGTGQTEIALYGYLGIAVKVGAGVRRFNLT